MIGKTVSHYRIIEMLGEGGMGVVYKAEDETLRRSVALKFLAKSAVGDAEYKARFLREARAAAALDHPNICGIYEIGESDGEFFMAMPFLEGQSLDKRIRQGPLPLADALEIAVQTCQALEEAHGKDIVHRDIKTANIMVRQRGPRLHATLMDFGLALLAQSTRITKEGSKLGTAAYMSPEQVQGDAADHRTDLWALGVVLYEMVHRDSAVQVGIRAGAVLQHPQRAAAADDGSAQRRADGAGAHRRQVPGEETRGRAISRRPNCWWI